MSTPELPGATCPHCGAEPRPAGRILHATPVLMTSGFELVREYLCWDCGARWSVEGRQEMLFELDGQRDLFGATAPTVDMLGDCKR